MQTRLLCVVALALAVSSCGPVRPQDRMCQVSQGAGLNGPDLLRPERYFPEDFPEQRQPDACGIERPRLSEIEIEWYARQWSAACEPPLEDAVELEGDSDFAFRFSYLPSFDSPLFVRLEEVDDGARLIVKQMTGDGGHQPGVVSRSKNIELTPEEVAAIRDSMADILVARDARIAAARLEGRKDTCFGFMDGTMWIFESIEGGHYDMVSANSPREGPLFDLGHMLLTKTGWAELPEH